jgi:hypothetical protein
VTLSRVAGPTNASANPQRRNSAIPRVAIHEIPPVKRRSRPLEQKGPANRVAVAQQGSVPPEKRIVAENAATGNCTAPVRHAGQRDGNPHLTNGH